MIPISLLAVGWSFAAFETTAIPSLIQFPSIPASSMGCENDIMVLLGSANIDFGTMITPIL